uniref:Uncharacterized protein n=1 Tax=Anguilla anguilla TaxID=7936 RepID=A0A0E9RE53_ANGAN
MFDTCLAFGEVLVGPSDAIPFSTEVLDRYEFRSHLPGFKNHVNYHKNILPLTI